MTGADRRRGHPTIRLGVAHHYGWAVVVAASDADHAVVDRRRIELVGQGLPAAPIHHEGGPHEMHRTGEPLDDDALAALVERVRASVAHSTAAALDQLATALDRPIESVSLRSWGELPSDIVTLRRPPHESRADSVMYLELLAADAERRNWSVHRYDAKRVEAEAAAILGERAAAVLDGPRRTLGPPWAKDHRMALAATVVAAS